MCFVNTNLCYLWVLAPRCSFPLLCLLAESRREPILSGLLESQKAEFGSLQDIIGTKTMKYMYSCMHTYTDTSTSCHCFSDLWHPVCYTHWKLARMRIYI